MHVQFDAFRTISECYMAAHRTQPTEVGLLCAFWPRKTLPQSAAGQKTRSLKGPGQHGESQGPPEEVTLPTRILSNAWAKMAQHGVGAVAGV
jgi:hypothetical protein